MRTAPIIVIAGMASVGAARAQPARPRVAVVVDFVANVSPERSAELSSAMADALNRRLDVDTLGGADVVRRLPAGGVPEDCVVKPGCVADLAARLDASELLLLSMVQLDAVVQIDTTWIDAASGQAIARPRIELQADARAGEVFTSEAGRLLPGAHPRPQLAPVLEPAAPTAPREERSMSPATWALLGGGTAALAGGAVLGLTVRGTYQRCEREPDRCSADDRRGLRTRGIIADGLAVAGTVGVATALVLYLRSTHVVDEPAQTAWQLRPTSDGAMAEIYGRF